MQFATCQATFPTRLSPLCRQLGYSPSTSTAEAEAPDAFGTSPSPSSYWLPGQLTYILGSYTLDTVGSYTSSGPCDNFAAATCTPNVTGGLGPARPPARPPPCLPACLPAGVAQLRSKSGMRSCSSASAPTPSLAGPAPPQGGLPAGRRLTRLPGELASWHQLADVPLHVPTHPPLAGPAPPDAQGSGLALRIFKSTTSSKSPP